MKSSYDIVVIGAGPAGAVASTHLLQCGYSVAVLEKMEFPRFVIGESLLPKAMEYLEKTDLLQCVVDQKYQLKTGVTFYHDDKVCPFLFNDQYTDSWDHTYQVKRADFDKVLIDEAAKKGVEVQFNAEVTNVVTSPEKQSVTYLLDGEEHTIECRFVIDASGYGRVLPRMFDLEKAAGSVPRGAIFSHVKDAHRSAEASANIFIHAFNEEHDWIWSIPFSDGTASVGVVGSVDVINELAENNGAKFKEFVKSFPGLEERFHDTEFLFEPRKILGYSISVEKMYGEGFVLCGNSTEFLDPIFSSGVTLAVTSGYEAAELVKRQLKGERVDWENEYTKFMEFGIDVFRSYVNGWYDGDLHKIFFAPDANPEFKRQICSVLAGHVWDKTNPFVAKHDKILKTLSKVVSITG